MENNVVSAILDSAYKSRTPFCCSLEITKRCNFNCIHCYLRDNHIIEMNYQDVINVIDQIRDAGTLFLNLIGGEIMLHPQFCEIYSYAYEKGMIITLLTNASMMNKDIRELLRKMPPRKIEITVYGYTREIFKNVTKSSINQNIIFRNIEILKEDGHNILLKMIVMKENKIEFDKIKEYAKQRNIPFQYDFNILPTLKGDRNVIEHELSVDDVICLEIADGKKINGKYVLRIMI